MSRYLIDSHVILWAMAADPRLRPAHADILRDAPQDCAISIATVWELSIKESLGKLTVPADFLTRIEDAGIHWLPISPPHARHVSSLPMHHRDPFDRMLVAQCVVDDLRLLSDDKAFRDYDIVVV